ncbi:MAG: hypothetical protein FJW36_15460 [Acidobacteria bacterium]|nr:hypothetical protein [Acidobacteriota bacterium]
MFNTTSKQTLADSLERIQALVSELRQTEALEAQVHEMVVMKRHRLDALMTDFLERAGEDAPQQRTAPLPAPLPPPKPVVEPPPLPKPKPVEDLPLSQHGSYGAPTDLLQGRPAPSAQHVLDSLNRLMTGIKDMSGKQVNAA